MTYNVFSGTLNLTQSITTAVSVSVMFALNNRDGCLLSLVKY